MPTFRHGKATGVAIQEHDLTAFLNEATSSTEVETGDTTTFANSARTYIVGLAGGTLSVSGLWSGDDFGVDEILDGAVAVDDGAHILVQQAYDDKSVGVRTAFAKGELTSYEISSPVGDVVAVSAEVQADGGILHGVMLSDPGTSGFQQVSGGSSTSNSSVDDGGSSSDGAKAQMHVTDNSLDGNLVVTVEDSTDDSTWNTLATFSTVNAGNRAVEQIAATGTVQRYVRITIDATAASSGSATIAVGFHRD